MNVKVVVVLAIVLVALCLSDGECARRRRRGRRAPGSVRGRGSSARARAAPSEPSSRCFAQGRSRQSPSRGALPQGAALEAPSVAASVVATTRAEASRSAAGLGSGAVGGRQTRVRQDPWLRARQKRAGAERSRGPRAPGVALPPSPSPCPPACGSVSRGEGTPRPRCAGCGRCECERAFRQACLASRRAGGGGAVGRCCAASPLGEAAPLSAPTLPRLSGRAKQSSCRVCAVRPAALLHSSTLRSDAANPGARPACFLASSRGHRREAQGPPGSLMPLPCPPNTPAGWRLCRRPSHRSYPRMSAAAKFNRQGLRPLGKVVSCFTGRGRALFFFF